MLGFTHTQLARRTLRASLNKPMQIAPTQIGPFQISKKLQSYSQLSVLAILLTACANSATSASTSPSLLPGLSIGAIASQTTSQAVSSKTASSALSQKAAKVSPTDSRSTNRAGLKTEEEPGTVIGPATDCDGDGVNDDARFDFNNDGAADECVVGGQEAAIPEPPFVQSYVPSNEAFYSTLPEVGWNMRYQCGDGLYEISLARPSEDQLRYSADGIILTTPIIYDDIDPNLNRPLLIQEPVEGIRYAFTQEQDGEFYEYAIADYSGSVGLYVYQTGEQVVAAPCTTVANAS